MDSGKQERWVCPNDRHLALRAKLKMGWSTSHATPVNRQDSLNEHEQQSILQVVQRAEELEKNEQLRIGRLVERVEIMKIRSQGNGTTTCILCGEGLPLIRTSNLVCADCSKSVCSKCGVETLGSNRENLWLCKICAETREMWKRSGAWFFRGVPKYILPGQGAPATSNSTPTSVSAASSAPSSPSVSTATTTNTTATTMAAANSTAAATAAASGNQGSSPGFRRSRPPPRRTMTWAKRSGCSTETDTSSEDETHRKHRLQKSSSECVPSDHDPVSPRPGSISPFRYDSAALNALATRGDSSADDHGEDSQQPPRSPVSPSLLRHGGGSGGSGGGSWSESGGTTTSGGLLAPRYSPSPLSLSPRTELKRDGAVDRSPSPLLRVAWRDSGRGSNSSFSDSPTMSKDDPDLDPSSSSTTTPPTSCDVIDASTPSNQIHSSSTSPSVNGVRSRRDSEASKGSEEKPRRPFLARMTNDSRDSKDSKDSRDSRDSLLSRESTREELGASSQDEASLDGISTASHKEGGLGTIEFSLLYDSHNQALHCTLHSARNLRPSDSNGLSDPYVKLHLLPGACKSNKLRTRTVCKTLCPDFNETLTYYGISDHEMARKTLRLTVLDEDRFGHDFLGEARVALKDVRPHETRRIRKTLERRITHVDDDVKGEAERGKILLSLKYSSQRGALVVGVVRCAHLPSMDSNGFSDPYVKVQLKPDPQHRKHRTAVKWRNLNPEFNEEFALECRRHELPKKLLDIRVYDKDVGRSDDFIGGIQLCQDSKGPELRHWYDALQYPDRRHDRWHPLQPLNGK